MKLHTAFPLEIDGESYVGIFEGWRRGLGLCRRDENGLIVSKHSLPARIFDGTMPPGRYVFKTGGHDFIVDTHQTVS